eukprot:g7468.t1
MHTDGCLGAADFDGKCTGALFKACGAYRLDSAPNMQAAVCKKKIDDQGRVTYTGYGYICPWSSKGTTTQQFDRKRWWFLGDQVNTGRKKHFPVVDTIGDMLACNGWAKEYGSWFVRSQRVQPGDATLRVRVPSGAGTVFGKDTYVGLRRVVPANSQDLAAPNGNGGGTRPVGSERSYQFAIDCALVFTSGGRVMSYNLTRAACSESECPEYFPHGRPDGNTPTLVRVGLYTADDEFDVERVGTDVIFRKNGKFMSRCGSPLRAAELNGTAASDHAGCRAVTYTQPSAALLVPDKLGRCYLMPAAAPAGGNWSAALVPAAGSEGRELLHTYAYTFAGACAHGALLEPPRSRTRKDHCGRCDAGYVLHPEQLRCVRAYAGACAHGSLHRNVYTRTREDECATCDAGYRLVAPTAMCVPRFSDRCVNGTGVANVLRRTAENQCTACDATTGATLRRLSDGASCTSPVSTLVTSPSCQNGNFDQASKECKCNAGYTGGGKATTAFGEYLSCAEACTCSWTPALAAATATSTQEVNQSATPPAPSPSSLFVCNCPHGGTAAEGDACPADGREVCGACHEGYYLSNSSSL